MKVPLLMVDCAGECCLLGGGEEVEEEEEEEEGGDWMMTFLPWLFVPRGCDDDDDDCTEDDREPFMADFIYLSILVDQQGSWYLIVGSWSWTRHRQSKRRKSVCQN